MCNGSSPNWSIANISGSSANRIKELIQHGVLHRSDPIISLWNILCSEIIFHTTVPRQTLTHTSNRYLCLPMWRVCRGGEIRYRFSSGTFHTHCCSFVDRVRFGCTFCKATAEWVGRRRGSNPEVVLRHFTTRSGQRRTEAPEIKWWRVPIHSNFTFYCNILECVYFPKILGSMRRNT